MCCGALMMLACAKLPHGRAAIDAVDVEGNDTVSGGDIEEKMATRSSPKFLGLFRGVVFDYEVFDLYVLQRDLARVERYYRARGFYKARARAGRVYYVDPHHVRVEVQVLEGPPTSIAKIAIQGLDGVDDDTATLAREAVDLRLEKGARFEEDSFSEAEDALRRALTDNGYAWAKVKRTAQVDLPSDRAFVRFDVEPGPVAHYGQISVSGLEDLPESKLRNALLLTPGDRYSTAEIEDAQQAALDLGVFSSVEIQSKLGEGPNPERVVPLHVQVQPSTLHAVKLGVGAQLDVTRADVHLIAGWEHKNLFGGLRHFSVELRPGLVFYPTRFPSLQPPTHYLPEAKLHSELRQPGFIEGRTNGFVRGEYNIYPVLLSTEVDSKAPILGYREAKGTVGVDRKFWRFYARPSYNVEYNTPFAYAGQLDSALDPLFISYGSLFGTLDFRDDYVEPHQGVFLAGEVQVAGGPFGGDAQDVKLEPEARFYVPLGRDLTLAMRAATGFVFPRNYGDSIESNAKNRRPPPGVSRDAWARDVQIAFFRALFSGGPSSNRGYGLHGVGPHGVIPFFRPDLAAQQLTTSCDPQSPDYDSARCALPLGGLTRWEASIGLRYDISDPLSGAVFCDSSDVAPTELTFRFDRPHLSCGVGARYGTPVGPVRLDLGYRVPGLQTLGDDSGEGVPPTLFGAPIAVHIAIGEAF